MAAIVHIETTHPLFAVAQVKGLFFVYFDKCTFPWTKGCTFIDITEQSIACSIIEGIGNDKFDPAIQWHIKGIGIFEISRIPLKDQFFRVHTKVAQQAIGDMRMSQLVLDDRDSRTEGIQRRRMDSRVVVGWCTNQFGISRDGEYSLHPFQVDWTHMFNRLNELLLTNTT